MSQINAVRTKLAAVWQAQLTTDGITGVTVRKFNPADQAGKTDVVYIGNITATQEDSHYSVRSEAVEVTAYIVTFKAGVGDTVADAAEDRALALLDSLEEALVANSTLDDTVVHGSLSTVSSDLDASPEGYHCTLELLVNVDVTL